jgi:hypothetical protein
MNSCGHPSSRIGLYYQRSSDRQFLCQLCNLLANLASINRGNVNKISHFQNRIAASSSAPEGKNPAINRSKSFRAVQKFLGGSKRMKPFPELYEKNYEGKITEDTRSARSSRALSASGGLAQFFTASKRNSLLLGFALIPCRRLDLVGLFGGSLHAVTK